MEFSSIMMEFSLSMGFGRFYIVLDTEPERSIECTAFASNPANTKNTKRRALRQAYAESEDTASDS